MASYTGTITTNTAPLRIRAGASTSNSIKGRIPKGAKVNITEVIDKGNGWKWGKVTYNGVTGYCCINEPGVGQWVKLDVNKKQTPPAEPVKKPAEKKDPVPASGTGQNQKATGNTLKAEATQGINGTAVQYGSEKLSASGYEDVDSVSTSDGAELVLRTGENTNDLNEPRFIQNAQNFPPVLGIGPDGLYQYDYYMDYTDMQKDFDAIYNNNHLGLRSRHSEYIASGKFYNRFKLPNIQNVLARSFSHVFFIRPDLNAVTCSGGTVDLGKTVRNNSDFYWAKEHSPEILKELTQESYDHNFSFMLSNAVKSFELSDQYIKNDEYGESCSGHKIAYGKSDGESKASGTFNVTYNDDRDLHITNIHHLWINYISGIFKGKYKAKDEYIRKKILDYVSAVYYFLTAEDGETIIFWSKYYGVFPTNIPSSQFSYSHGNIIANPEIQIQYAYSYKEDFNPLSLVEFNMQSPRESIYKYRKTYNKELLGTGKTLVGAPFIETFRDSFHDPYTFKLRFR